MKLKVTADLLRVRKEPSLEGEIIGKLSRNSIVDLIRYSEDNNWYEIKNEEVEGWSFYKYFTEAESHDNSIYAEIFDVVMSSSITKYYWRDRGYAPIGYYKGMALSFARMYCKLKVNNDTAKEMAKASTGDKAKDVLAFYAGRMSEVGLYNEADGVSTLRNLFTLMVGLGMRESSGRYCLGAERDKNGNIINNGSNTAEAGLFQTSYNAKKSHPLLSTIFSEYKDKQDDGFLEVFKEGVSCKATEYFNCGEGEGMTFQRLTKDCPAFGVEFTGVALRNVRSHWGPINHRNVEVKKECNDLFLKVQYIIDMNNVTNI